MSTPHAESGLWKILPSLANGQGWGVPWSGDSNHSPEPKGILKPKTGPGWENKEETPVSFVLLGSGQGEGCAPSGLKGLSDLCLESAFAPRESPTSHPGCLPCPLAIPNITCRGRHSWKAADTRPHPPPLLEVPSNKNPSSAPRTRGDPVGCRGPVGPAHPPLGRWHLPGQSHPPEFCFIFFSDS